MGVETRLDMTPLIDVVFLLLIFFLLTSRFFVSQAIDIELPVSSTATTMQDSSLVVVVHADGHVTLNDTEVTVAELAGTVEREIKDDADRLVTLKSDAHVEVQSMLRVLDAIRSAGAHSIALATRPDA